MTVAGTRSSRRPTVGTVDAAGGGGGGGRAPDARWHPSAVPLPCGCRCAFRMLVAARRCASSAAGDSRGGPDPLPRRSGHRWPRHAMGMLPDSIATRDAEGPDHRPRRAPPPRFHRERGRGRGRGLCALGEKGEPPPANRARPATPRRGGVSRGRWAARARRDAASRPDTDPASADVVSEGSGWGAPEKRRGPAAPRRGAPPGREHLPHAGGRCPAGPRGPRVDAPPPAVTGRRRDPRRPRLVPPLRRGRCGWEGAGAAIRRARRSCGAWPRFL